MKLAATAILVLLAAPLAAAGGGKIKWRAGKDHDAALKEAKAVGQPVLLYFTSDG